MEYIYYLASYYLAGAKVWEDLLYSLMPESLVSCAVHKALTVAILEYDYNMNHTGHQISLIYTRKKVTNIYSLAKVLIRSAVSISSTVKVTNLVASRKLLKT